MVPIVEEVHNKLAPILKHTPDLKTQVVLVDVVDYANGFTTVIPNPLITLYVTDGGSNLRPVAYETWLKYVFLHEYAHVLHLDTTEGSARLFKQLFGRISFPNALEPNFITEGMATYFETYHGYGGGRGKDARFDAMMRMDILENNIKSIEQAAVDTVRWPGGSLRYLYGVEFLQYLAEQYGEDRLIRLSQEYGDYFLSGYGLDGLFKTTFGKGINLLWKEWLDYLKVKYQKEKVKIEAEGLTPVKVLTNRGYYILKPKWSPDGRYLYYSQNDQQEYSQIRRFEVLTSKDEKVLEGLVLDDSLGLQGDKLYYVRNDIHHNYYVLKDLYVYDLSSRQNQRLTEGARLFDPAVSKDGGQLICAHNEQGRRTLWLMSSKRDKPRILGDYGEEVQYMSPNFSSDGRRLAVAKWTPGGKQDIYLIEVQTGREEKLVSLGLSANPCFSPDDRYVIFDSDISGVVNLYACEIKTRKLYRLTNVLGAAMMPEISPDGGKLAFINYSSRGHDLAIMDFDAKSLKEAEIKEGAKIQDEVKTKIKEEKELTGILTPDHLKTKSPTFETQAHDYNPLVSFLPKFWLPYTFYTENGPNTLVYTAGLDALSQHYAELQLGYDWMAYRPFYYLSYANNQFLPQVTFSVYDTSTAFDWGSGLTYWERERGGGVGLTLYDNRVLHEYDKQTLTLGYIAENLFNITSLEVLSTPPSRGDLKGAYLAWRYSSARQYGYSISPEDGLDLSLKAYSFSRELGSNYNFNKYLLSGSQYFGLPAHQVLVLIGKATVFRGEQLVQGGYTWSYQTVRGYPSRSFPGTKLGLTTLEYRFPIALFESGWEYGLTFFDRLWGSLFLEAGDATYGRVEDLILKKSYGLELNLNTINVYGYVPFTLNITYAKGIDAGGEEQIYFGFSL